VSAPADGAPETSRRLDLRLLIPALVAWAAAVVMLPHPPRWQLAGAVGAVLFGTVTAVALRRLARPAAVVVGGQVLLGSVTVGLVLLAAAGHGTIDRAGPVLELAETRAVVQVTGRVLTEPRVVQHSDERADLVVLRLRVEQVTARGRTSTPSTPVLVLADAGTGWEDVRWHAQVGTVGRLSPSREPGGDVVAVFSPQDGPATLSPPSPSVRWAEPARERLRAAVDPLPVDARGLIPGLVIGDTSLTPPELTEAMLDTGMSHLSAVSGSNVAIVLGAVVVLCGWTGVPRRWRAPLALVALVGFVVLCRPEPSVLRAGAMGVVGLVALSTARRRVSLPALAVAVVVLLCVDPSLARSYGFALSTLATLGLVVFARPWGDAIARRLPRRAALMGDAIAIPLAAQVVCAPVIVLLQGNISTVAVLANLLAAPLVAPTTIAGIAAAVVGVAWLPGAVLVAWLGALPAWLIGRIARVCATVPLGQVDWVDGPAGAWLLTGLTVLLLLAGPRLRWECARHPYAAGSALLLVAAALLPVPGPSGWPPRGWVVAGCDVGQGDAFVVPTGPSSAVLVDAGADPELVVACLRRLGVRRLDGLVLSHFHADHVGGVSGVVQAVPVGAAYVTPVRDPPVQADRTRELLAAVGVPVHEVAAGDLLQWGGVRARVLWPNRGLGAAVGANDASLVLDVDVGRTRVLFTGDIEELAAGRLRRILAGQRVDVLKVAHHGSADQDTALVQGLAARVAMIGVGTDNTFGHPAPSTLSLLRRSGAVVLRTDLDGDIAVVETGDGWAVATRGG
jgi:competence protein ComEC